MKSNSHLLKSKVRPHLRDGCCREMAQNENANRRRKIAARSVAINLSDELGSGSAFLTGNLFQRVPELRFKADACVCSVEFYQALFFPLYGIVTDAEALFPN
jgi:hypothetical protein